MYVRGVIGVDIKEAGDVSKVTRRHVVEFSGRSFQNLFDRKSTLNAIISRFETGLSVSQFNPIFFIHS